MTNDPLRERAEKILEIATTSMELVAGIEQALLEAKAEEAKIFKSAIEAYKRLDRHFIRIEAFEEAAKVASQCDGGCEVPDGHIDAEKSIRALKNSYGKESGKV